MKFSIVTVNFNDKVGLQRTIDSVKAQNSTDYEYIVIDGGSTDGSREILEAESPYITYWVSEKDHGIYNGMNKGISVANGDYCLFLNSGDTFYSNDVLSDMEQYLNYDILCGDAMLICEQPYKWNAPDIVDKSFWLKRFSICHQSTFIKTSLLKEIPYDETYRIVADYCFFFYTTVVKNCSYSRVPLIICNYGCDGVSSDSKRADAEKIKVIDSFRRDGLIPLDPLVECSKRLKPGTRRYNLALAVLNKLAK